MAMESVETQSAERRESTNEELLKRLESTNVNEIAAVFQEVAQRQDMLSAELGGALLDKGMSVHTWINRSHVPSWQTDYAIRELQYPLAAALLPKELNDKKAKQHQRDVYKKLVDTYAILTKEYDHAGAQWGGLLLSSLFRGVDPQLLMERALERICNPEEIKAPTRGHREIVKSINWRTSQSNWLEAYRATLFGDGSEEVQNRFADTCSELSWSEKGSGDALLFLRKTMFGRRYARHSSKRDARSERSLLQKLIDEQKGTYFFNLYARGLATRLDEGDNPHDIHIRDEDAYEPFRVSPNQFGFFRSGDGAQTLLVSDPADFQHIQALLQEIDELRPALRERSARLAYLVDTLGPGVDDWPPDAAAEWLTKTKEEEEREKLWDEIATYFDEQSASVAISDSFAALYSRDFRDEITNAIGVDISNLPITEQKYFLDFADHSSPSTGSKLESFSRNFGENGLRTFLASRYDEEAPEHILSLAAHVDENMVHNMFAHYASTMDEFRVVKERIKQNSGKVPSIPAFADHMYEAVIHRAADFFRAGSLMASERYGDMKQQPGETISDLEHVMEGAYLISRVIRGAVSEDGAYMFLKNAQRSSDVTDTFLVTDTHTQEQFTFKVLIRPTQERGQGEARINFELVVPPGHELFETFASEETYTDGKEMTRASIRLGFDLDTSVDPPTLSFDWGRDVYEGGNRLVHRSGDAMGRILGVVGSEGHHLMERFPPELSDPDTFATVARRIKSLVAQNHGTDQ